MELMARQRRKIEDRKAAESKPIPTKSRTWRVDPKENAKLQERFKKQQAKKTSTKSTTKSEPKKSTVFTKHYKTGKELGVMTRAQRRKYDKEAAGRTFEGQMKKAGLKKDDPRRETKFTSKRWQKRTKGGALKDSKKNRGSGRTGSFGKGTYGKGLPSNPKLKSQKTKDKRNPNRHKISVKKKKQWGEKLIKKMFD
tara:strand:- start:922 stop:1509 length:588 start_codon:yes stop_codon:yes gene_type:complete